MNIPVKFKMITLCLFVIFFALGCATALDQTLDQKLALEPTIANSTELSQQVKAEIEKDTSLTDAQKIELGKVRESTALELKVLREQSLKLRIILVRDFQSSNDLEIDLIHDRLDSNSKKQVSLIFEALRDAERIIGHTPHDRKWMVEMFNEDRGHEK